MATHSNPIIISPVRLLRSSCFSSAHLLFQLVICLRYCEHKRVETLQGFLFKPFLQICLFYGSRVSRCRQRPGLYVTKTTNAKIIFSEMSFDDSGLHKADALWRNRPRIQSLSINNYHYYWKLLFSF